MPVEMRMFHFAVFGAFLAGNTLTSGQPAPDPAEPPSLPPGLYARFETNRGAFLTELFFQDAPLTVAHFAGLAEGRLPNAAKPPGEPFYDGLPFHRVVPGFVVQGGDPLGNGSGGPGYVFPDEFSPRLRHGQTGILSMANDGANRNGSQFFITLDDRQDRLNYNHSVFGRVVQGMDVVLALAEGDRMDKVVLLRVGPEAEAFATDAAAWKERLAAFAVIPDLPAAPVSFVSFLETPVESWFPAWMARKLHHFEKVRGIPLLICWLRSAGGAEPAPDSAVGEAAARLSEMLGRGSGLAGDSSILILYFAREDRWIIRIGRDLLGRFVEVGPEGDFDPTALHQAKQQILARARAGYETMNPRRWTEGIATALMLHLDATSPEGSPSR